MSDMSKVVASRQAVCAAASLQLRLLALAGNSMDGLRECDTLLLAFQAVEIARDAIRNYDQDMRDALQSDIAEGGVPVNA